LGYIQRKESRAYLSTEVSDLAQHSQGDVMSLRNRLVLLFVLSGLAVLAGCGSSGTSITHPVPPPSGGFSPSNLNGTYVFSTSGSDASGFAYAIVGTFNANGSGGITGGVLDLNDAGFPGSSISPVANASISGGSYSLGIDGRGQIKLNNSTPFSSPIILDYVLQDSTHGLVTEFDANASGSGSLDLQSSGVTPTGSYAFIFSGVFNTVPLATVGNFTLNGAAMTGLEDLNSDGIPYADALSGTFALGPSSTPATQISAAGTTPFAMTYDVFAIDATHLKFIEMDATGTLSGDAFAQTSTTFPSGTLAFTLIGSTTQTLTAAGGFIVTDGSGNITTSSSEDLNSTNGTVTSTPNGFSGTYAAGGTGRYTLSLTNFVGATEFAAYPSSAGVLLLELDNTGLMAGAAYPQTTGVTLDASQGYALNLSGENLGAATGQVAEVDDIAEFATAGSGLTLSGVTDENFAPSSSPIYAVALSGNYVTPDSSGRGQVVAMAGNSSNSTLNGGFGINYYAVDGTTFPFIEMDSGQIAAGVFVKQNSAASSSAATRPHLLVLPPVVRPRIEKRK
jgi:hypothetical protein